VRLQENKLVALGKGADPDIFTASAKAYINGLNRLEYMKKNPTLSPEERRL
jgi:2-isopropylmalate synthase